MNECSFIGNLGADPETTITANGATITKIRIACSEKWKDKQGQPQERTEWVRITFFGRSAEVIAEYMRKGAKIWVRGRMQTSEYERDGEKRYSTEIVADKFEFLGGRGDSGPREPREQAPRQPHQQAVVAADADFNDDIPF